MNQRQYQQDFEGTELENGNYKPSGFYFRSALRRSTTVDEAVAIGLVAVRELEHLKDWIRELGKEPPLRFVMKEEAEDKGWAYDAYAEPSDCVQSFNGKAKL